MAVPWVGRVLRRLVYRSAFRSGLDETQARVRAASYSGHSLRTGFVTSAVMAGVRNEDIAAHVGWSGTHHVFRYARRGETSAQQSRATGVELVRQRSAGRGDEPEGMGDGSGAPADV